jgi:hypothetical protein
VPTPTGPGILVGSPVFAGAVRQQNPVGQNLSANPNVNAPAGFGGDKWGANGGDITPVGGGATDQTGYLKSVVITPSSAETSTNYLNPGATTNVPVPGSRLGLLNSDSLPGQTLDPLGPVVGNNAG